MLRTRMTIGTLLALSAAGCGSASFLGPDAAQGVEGQVVIGPTCPVAREDDPCPDRPFQALLTVRGPGGVKVVTTDESGRFRVGLAPGHYVLRGREGNGPPSSTDLEIRVESGVWLEVTYSYDSGIR